MVQSKSEGQVRATYRDLLPDEYDAVMLRLVRDLDAGYKAVPAPAAIRGNAPHARGAVTRGDRRHPRRVEPDGMRPVAPPDRATAAGGHNTGSRRPLVWLRRWKRPLAVAGMLCLISAGVVLAANNLINLGKPTNDVSPLSSFPLDGFRHDGQILRSSFRPELLFLGTLSLGDHGSQLERWPVVKALDQFGSFSGLKPWMPPCPPGQNGPTPLRYCPLASFDWSHATYRSRYVTFIHRDLVDEKFHLYQRLSPNELRLFHRYEAHGKGYRDSVLRSIVFGETPTTTRVLPLVDVGGYHQTISQILTGNDLSYLPPGTGTTYNVPLSFGKIQAILQSGQDSGSSRTVEDVNAAANIMIALICHTDGLQPHQVCHRPAISQILKQVK